VLDAPPADTPALVRVRDGRNNVVQTLNLRTNAFGTIHGAFDLAEGAMLGTYAIEATVDQELHRQAFKVEDYRKPDYKVMVSTNGSRFISGETIEGTVESAYFFGEPVSGAKVAIKLYYLRERYWWETDTGSEYIWYADRNLGRGRTDAEGRFSFDWDATLCRNDRDPYWGSSLKRCTWGIEATVEDGSQQPVSGFAVLHVYSAKESVHLEAGGYLYAPGQAIPVEINVSTVFGEAVADRVVTLSVRRWTSGKRFRPGNEC
jgi:hypothetical protein